MRKAFEKTNGVKTFGANYFADFILVDYDEDIIDKATILAVIKKAGCDAITLAAGYW